MKQARPPLSFVIALTGITLACHRAEFPTPPGAPPTELSSPVAYGARRWTPPTNPVDQVESRRLIDAIATQIETHYVSREVAGRMVAALRDHQAQGHYFNIPQPEILCGSITQDLRDVSHDLHLRVVYHPGGAPPVQRPAKEVRAELRRIHYGFSAIERLAGNVAHLVIDEFPTSDEEGVRRAIGENMSRIADADALLLDLRTNHGGSPGTVALVASYLFDATPVHLNDMYRRDDDSTREFWTSRTVPGKRFAHPAAPHDLRRGRANIAHGKAGAQASFKDPHH